jgi:hypothetical protein
MVLRVEFDDSRRHTWLDGGSAKTGTQSGVFDQRTQEISA